MTIANELIESGEIQSKVVICHFLLVRCLLGMFLEQGILADDSISSAERRAASESLGVLARLGSDSYAARLVYVLSRYLVIEFSVILVCISTSSFKIKLLLLFLVWLTS